MKKNNKQTAVQSIKRHCKECAGGSSKEVRLCIIIDCPLYPYRLGKDPRRKGVGNRKANENLTKTKKDRI